MFRFALALMLADLAGCGRFNFDQVDPDEGCTGPFSVPRTDPILNSAATDWGASLSHDQLTLTFSSNRGGSYRLFQATRTTVDAPWSDPTMMAGIGDGADFYDPSLSADQLSLYWGNPAVSMARRSSVGAPWANVGVVLEGTASHTIDGGPDISPDGLILVATGSSTSDGIWHMYEARRSSTAVPFDTMREVPGLPQGAAFGAYGGDGLEVVFQDEASTHDLYLANRASIDDPFGPATWLTEVNTPDIENDPDLSDDGTTLWFSSTRPGGMGGSDLWFATRSCP